MTNKNSVLSGRIRCYCTETNCLFPCPAQLKIKELKGSDLLYRIKYLSKNSLEKDML